ncbi:MAG: sigma-70 family RNA polymerase sigma factor [Tepidisphaera sp.]
MPDSQAHGGDGQSTSRLLHPGVEHERLRRIWEDNRRWVAAILLAYKPRWADLEDLLQEVASSMVAKSSELRDPGAIRPWLRQVAINAARLAGRKGKLRLTKSLEESGPAEPGTIVPPESPTQAAPAVLGREEECRRMNELLASLPDGYREPLYLKAVQSLSYRQIGHILGLPETTVETRIARARRMIRELSAQAQASAQAGLARSPDPTP